MGALHLTPAQTKKAPSPGYYVAGTDKIAVPEAMRPIMGKSWSGTSTELRITTTVSLQVLDLMGRPAPPALAMCEVAKRMGSQSLFFCQNPYPHPDGGNAWLVVTQCGIAAFACRNLHLCRIYADVRNGLLVNAAAL